MLDEQSKPTNLLRVLRHGQFAPYIDELRERAQQGDSAAAIALGHIYFQGSADVDKDYVTARCWFDKVNLAYDTTGFAAGHLALIYYNGFGVPKDYKKAVRYLRSASLHGHANSRIMLAIIYKKRVATLNKSRSADTILRFAVCDSKLKRGMRFIALFWLSPLTKLIRP